VSYTNKCIRGHAEMSILKELMTRFNCVTKLVYFTFKYIAIDKYKQ